MFKRLSLMLILSVILLCAGCAVGSETTTPDNTDIQQILVGTEGTYKPFNFMDEDGNLIGYDIDVLKEVDRRIDALSFDFVAAQWDSLFLGMESGKYHMVADQLVQTEERRQKYQFAENSYFSAMTYLVVREDESEVNTLKDLEGKTIGVSVATLYANLLEEYNKENNDAITIRYYEGNITSIFQDLEAGRIDAAMNDKFIINDSIETLGLKIKTAGDPIDVSLCYHLFPQGAEGDALREKVDEALDAMIADGTLAEISISWFGEDLS